MSDNVVPFNNGEEPEQYSCPTCDLVLEFMSYVVETESSDELFEVLSGLVNEAKDLGVKEYLVHEIDSKIALFEHLEHGCCDEDCEC
jgi:hypothetical protein